MRRLYHHPLCPFSRKIRLTLAEKKIEIELIEEKPWEERLDFIRLNPAGDLPVLMLDEGGVIADSAAIFEYLEETGPEPRLLPADPLERAEARRLVAWFDRKFHAETTEPLLTERAIKRLSRSGHPDSARVKAGARALRPHLEYIGWLADRRNWLAGDRLSIADFAAAAHLSCLDHIGDMDWSISPSAKEWYARVKSRPAFRVLLNDHVPGVAPPAHYADPDF